MAYDTYNTLIVNMLVWRISPLELFDAESRNTLLELL